MKTQSTLNLFGISLGGLLSLIILGACATMPETNDMLAEARQQVNAAQEIPAVTQHAALQLQEAKGSLARAESLWEEDGEENIEEVEHYAYLAKQQANTAMQRAALGEAREEMELAGAAREQILRQAREQELQAAQQRAEQAEMQARTAQQRARQLERQERTQQLEQQAQATQLDEQQIQELRKTVKSLQAQQTQRGMVLTLGDVMFDFGQAELKPGGERAVEQLATFLERNPNQQLVVEGYTDSIGDEAFNTELARRRADAVRDQLLAAGVNSDRIQIKAYGEQYPVASNETPAGRQLNRRVEVVLAPPEEGSPEARETAPEGGTP